MNLVISVTTLKMKLLHIVKPSLLDWLLQVKKTLKTVWNNYVPLFDHCSKVVNDIKSDTKERSKYMGLKRILISVEFITNLGKFCIFCFYIEFLINL